MKIKFKRMEKMTTKPNMSGKTFPMVRVVGEALEGKLIGQEWSTKFFPSAKDMLTVVKNANVGDIIDVTMTQNGKFFNPTKMSIVDSPPEVSPEQQSSTIISSKKSKQDLRRERIKMAFSVLGQKKPKEDPFKYISNAAGIADIIEDYVNEKGAFQFDRKTSKNGIPEVEKNVGEDVENSSNNINNDDDDDIPEINI